MLLGVDTGGTFTDFVFYDGSEIRTHKVLSTPAAPEKAILQGLEEMGLLAAETLANLKMVHGSTVATNAVLEGKGVKTVYLTNRGLKDVIRIGRQARPALYQLQPEAINYLVAAEDCLEVDTRRDANGELLEALSDQSIKNIVKQINLIKPDSVAINLLFSYLNGDEEKRLQAALSADYFISCSSTVLKAHKEYERGMATTLNAYVGPLMQRYLSRLKDALPAVNISIMQSNTGTISVEQASQFAVNLLLSGPAGGLKGAQWLLSNQGQRQLLSFDMGGTSTDVALIGEQIELTTESKIAGFPVAIPMVDMHTIGAGGGSIAKVDDAGMLLVGPESAGAMPGPACYGGGGEQATVTDANVVLGRLPATQALGGYLHIDKAAAVASVQKIADKLAVSTEQAALGIIQLANEHMVQALRVISVQRGYDTAAASLVSFGGAGGLHICELAESLHMSSAIIPVHAGVLSALGMLVAKPSRELTLSINKPLAACDVSYIKEQFLKLYNEARELMSDERRSAEKSGYKEVVKYQLEVCYSGQSYQLAVDWQNIDQVSRDFHQQHKKRYGQSMQAPLQLVNLRLSMRLVTENIALPILKTNVMAEAKSHVAVVGETQSVAIYQREELAIGQRVSGPALIVEKVASSYIKTGWQLELDSIGNLILSNTH